LATFIHFSSSFQFQYTPRLIPQSYFDLRSKVDGISSQLDSTVLVTNTSRIFTMGNNQFGQLGNPSFTNASANLPVPVTSPIVPPANTSIIYFSVAAGSTHSVALGRNNVTSQTVMIAWGDNTFGQLGPISNSSISKTYSPMELNFTGTILDGVTISSVVAGLGYTLVLANGSVYGWGTNDLGQVCISFFGFSSNLIFPPSLFSSNSHSLDKVTMM